MTVRQEMQTATVNSRVLWPFVVAFQHCDGDLLVELDRVGLNEGQLRDPDVRIPYCTAGKLIDNLVKATGRGDLGLLAAREVERGHFDLLELAVRSAPTLGQAIDHLVHFFVLLDDGAVLTLERGREQSAMRLTFNAGPPIHPAYVEFIPSMLLLAARRETDVANLRAESACFQHQALAPVEPYDELFGCSVRFGAAENVATFPSGILTLPFRRANPPMQKEAVAAIGGCIPGCLSKGGN